MTPAPDEQPGVGQPDLTGGEPQHGAPHRGGDADGIAEALAAQAAREAAERGSAETGTVAAGQPAAEQPAADGSAADRGAEPEAASSTAADDERVLAETALAERTLDLQRLQAEYLNYKRRVERDRELVRQNATYSVLSGLLPVLDDIDRAREHGEVEGGFKAVADALDKAVASLGLTKFGSKGDQFDPNVHEALMHGHSPNVTTTTVDVVAHAGYRIGDRVVRAAKVTVLDPES